LARRIARQTGGLTPYFVGEGATITESDASYDQVELIAKKLAVRTRLSAELEEDSMVSIADRFVVDGARALAQKEDQCGFSGDGSSTYGGITGVRTKLLDFDGAGTDSIGAVAATSGDDQFEELIIGDFHKLLGLTPAYVFDGDPAWYISQTGWALTMQRLAAALGGVTMAEIAAGMEKRFLGYPVRICQAMPTTTAAQNLEIMLLFGDLSQAATLGNRRDIRLTVDRSVHVATDQIALFAIERFALVVHDVGNATTAGPILGIQGTT